jgi:hypothetical protein
MRRAPSTAGDRCGCKMGAVFVAIALIASVLWYAWQCHSSRMSIPSAFLRIMMWSLLAGCAGKIVGILKTALRRS